MQLVCRVYVLMLTVKQKALVINKKKKNAKVTPAAQKAFKGLIIYEFTG